MPRITTPKMAMRKRGVPRKELTIRINPWSKTLPRLVAMTTPTGMPISTPTRMEGMPIISVRGSLSLMMAETSRALSTDRPKSHRVRMPEIQFQYCTGSGRLRPILSR